MASPKSKPTSEATAPTPNSPDDPVQPPETPPPAAAGPEPDPAPNPGKSSKGAASATPEDVRLLAELVKADAEVDVANKLLAIAQNQRDLALTALGAHLVPPTAKRGEMFRIWVGTGAARKLYEASLVKDGKYLVRPWIG